MKLTTAVGSALVLLLAQAPGAAIGPYKPVTAGRAVNFTTCVFDDAAALESPRKTRCQNPDIRSSVTVSGPAKRSRVTLQTERGSYRFDIPDLFRHLSKVHIADLNGDTRNDFVLETWSGGAGLAASTGQIVFLLSAGESYTASRLHTEGFTADDIVWSNSGGAQVTHSDRCLAKMKDGKSRDFWVHHTFEVKNDRLVLRPVEPVWIMFTKENNRLPTEKVSANQKKLAWEQKQKERPTLGVDVYVPVGSGRSASPPAAGR